MRPGELRHLNIAVIGGGISGLSAAWLLSHKHRVILFEKSARLGGHSNTIEVSTPTASIPIDTGFIVYNPVNYPNLVSLFEHLDVSSKSSNMSFAVSLDDGGFEYSGSSLASLVAQKRNLLRLRFWSMLVGLLRFYRQASRDLPILRAYEMSLGEYLSWRKFGTAFERDHLLPMAGAIWSAPPSTLRDYPAASFVSFFDNHGLLKLYERPQWRTVSGGSREYVKKIAHCLAGRIRLSAISGVERKDGGIRIRETSGAISHFDHVVIATHADQALSLLADASAAERSLLGAFRYTPNLAVLHSDEDLMPKRRSAWSSWNYLGATSDGGDTLSVTYWMNALQAIPGPQNFFVTLNPARAPAAHKQHFATTYEHPVFDAEALRAQRKLGTLQGSRNTWFCGSYFGSGFHEDGLVSGLSVAEAIGGVSRPWKSSGGKAVESEAFGHRDPELVS